MINLQDLNIKDLPFVMLEDFRKIPRYTGGIYFLVTDEILYVGQAGNIKTRFNTHKLRYLYKDYCDVKLCWIDTPYMFTDFVEKFYIDLYKPIYNHIGVKTKFWTKSSSIANLSLESDILTSLKIFTGKKYLYTKDIEKVFESKVLSSLSIKRAFEDSYLVLPLETLRKIETVLGVDFGVKLD